MILCGRFSQTDVLRLTDKLILTQSMRSGLSIDVLVSAMPIREVFSAVLKRVCC